MAVWKYGRGSSHAALYYPICTSMTILDFIRDNDARYLEELRDFLSIPSVSTAPEHKQDVARCADWVSNQLAAIGLDNVQIFPTGGHPVVYGEWLHAGSDAPTVLFYGHYDVQPVDPLNLWTNPPFEPVVRDGKIYARGAVDDKGQVFLQMKSLEAHLKVNGKLPVNVKVLIEGEEEIGSIHLEQFLSDHSAMLACDTVLVSDTSMFGENLPSLCYGLRGLTYMEVHVTGPNRDLHSGSFGGAIENPVNALCSIIAGLKDERGRVTIEGFYDDVLPVTPEERAQFARLPFDEEAFCRANGVAAVGGGEKDYTPLERLWARPTLDVNGIWGGFTGEGAKTVLPSKAAAKISMRLVANQNTEDIAAKFTQHILRHAPESVKVEVHTLHGGNPAITPIDTPAMAAAHRALQQAFGVEPFYIREGGSIPIVLLFETILHAPTVLMGFGLPNENAHSPDEHFDLSNFRRGIVASALFYNELA